MTLLAVSASILVAQTVGAALPHGSVLVGLRGDQWRVHVVDEPGGALRAVATEGEPRTPDFCAPEAAIVYVAETGAVREVSVASGRDRVLLPQRRDEAYTQPAYTRDCRGVLVVALKDGNSQETDVVRIDRNGGAREDIVRQRSAQFDPFAAADGRVYYGNVHCTVGCGKIIEEIWYFDPVAEVAEQITLLNAISQQPALAPNDAYLYFSSDRAGSFHIWRQRLPSGEAERLTDGATSDASPALDGAGALYFLRRSPSGTALMRRTAEGETARVDLGAVFEDLRDFKIDWRAAGASQ
jgi:Tol biopolymer transport system component